MRRIARIDELIRRLNILYEKSEGSRKFTWKIKIHEAEVERRRLKRGQKMRKRSGSSKGISEGSGWVSTVQGGAPGLKK